MNRFQFIVLAFLLNTTVSAQHTIGLFQYDPGSYEGYSLFTPLTASETFMIDNCGREVHSWPGNYTPGNSTYLQPDGTLLRTGRLSSTVFSGGGIGGRVERVDWAGNVTWSYPYASGTYHQHHDVALLPNGNILLLAWESKSSSEAASAGRNPTTANMGLWPEHIVELQPTGTNGATIVWEWHVWDHLVQDFDNSKANYGVVADHPELIDLNYTIGGGGPGGQLDWLHCNAIAYNATLDQIVLNSRNFSEFWVIDHSTSTAEAASHSGGNSGKGGDILYRWGNPQTYDRGTPADRQLYVQHDVHWIPADRPGAGSFIIFNNGQGRPGGNHSRVEIVVPPVDAQGNYTLAPGQPYGPTAPAWNYTAPNPSDFYSSNISGASRMPNGNVLICEGAKGKFFEVDSTGTKVWEYINPIALGNALGQGATPNGNQVFRVERYAPDYTGLAGQDLSPGNELEINPLPRPAICDATALPAADLSGWQVAPSPFAGTLRVFNPESESLELEVRELSGRLVQRRSLHPGSNEVDAQTWASGMYLLRVPQLPGAVWKVVRE